MNGQIAVKTIKNGLRVEYTIGREDTKYLVPRLIEKERFIKNIHAPLIIAMCEKYGIDMSVYPNIEDLELAISEGKIDKTIDKELKSHADYNNLIAFYSMLKDPNTVSTDRELAEMQQQYPITKKN